MKRILAVLLCCLCLPAAVLAFDLTPYEISAFDDTAAALQANGIENRFSLEGHPYRLFSCGGVHIGFHETEGEPAQFMLYSSDFTCFIRGQLPSERAELCSLHPDGDSVLISLFLPMKPKSQILAARIGREGQLRWQHMSDYDALNSTVALPDGAGGAWLSTPVVDPNAYDPYAGTRLTHINAQGEAEYSRILKTGSEILLAQSAISNPESGCATLYCTLVAKSKDVYTALAVTLDPSGNILHAQARDFSMPQDTSFEYRIRADGTPWVFSRGKMYSGGKGILIPFDDLPALPSPALIFQ